MPDTIYVPREFLPLLRDEEPERWEQIVASDDPVVTRMNGPWSASSSSARWVMNFMLDALQLQPGMKILKIGTGTGWNAALIAAAGVVVTTIEIAGDIAEHARAAFGKAGLPDVVVVCGDGEVGVPEHAPHYRLIATAAVHTVPYAWVSQVSEGGLIVLLYSGKHDLSGLAVITVRDGTASGRVIHDKGWFMPMRGQA